jgi:hypothetical protein
MLERLGNFVILLRDISMARLGFLLASVCLAGIGCLGRADEPRTTQAPPVATGDAALNQEILSRQFRDFKQALLRLAQRLEGSSKPEDRERAVNLKKAIALASEKEVDSGFEKLIALLKASKSLSVQEIQEAMSRNQMLAQDIKSILALLLADNRDDELKREQNRLQDLVKLLDKVIANQKRARAQTESGKSDKESLTKAQSKVTKDTAEIARSMGKKDAKSDSEAKGGAKGDQAKDGKESKGSKGDAKDGKKGQGQGQAGQENKNGKQSANPDGKQRPPDESPGKKQVEDANEYQKQAEKDIDKDQRADASQKQDKAIDELEKARKRLEEILRQLREEEIERLLAALEQRCNRMLQMQIEVHHATVRVDRDIQDTPEKTAARVHEQRALQLSDQEEKIVQEADKAIQLLEAEGSAVAFPEVFTQIRDDMKNVARRLGKADVGNVTQVIEEDIINTLKEMIESLKKAQQNAQARKSQGGQSPPLNQKFIDLLAELKMIRAMQVRVNTRTRVYGEKYTGEQTADPDIQGELANLAQRQMKILDVTNNIYKGKNR